jgi:hypothetical protein
MDSHCCGQARFARSTRAPVAQVDAKIENNGVHVPSAQAKMAKLFSMRSATTKTSNATTTARNGSAVVSGLVQAKRVK